MNPLFLEAVVLARKITRLHYQDRAVDEFLSYLDPAVTWFGCGEDEFSLRYEEIVAYFERARDIVPQCVLWDEEYYLAADLGDACVVVGRFRARTDESAKMLLEVHQRITYVFRPVEGTLKVVHLHASNPYDDLKHGEMFPAKVGKSTYDYLNRVIEDKTEQIQVMLSAMTGGLKGSRDDDTYSYFYVSDELCAMLGYTRKEFMEMSGGCAVGAAYPPDLPAALAQCGECFARGDSYAAEYRMRKKDGSLIWVLDSGRKVKNAEGTTINSIILDITDKKWADAEIIKQRDFLQSFYNTMLSGLVQITAEDVPRVLNANKAAAEILGVAGEAVEALQQGGVSAFSFIYPQDVDYVWRVFNHLRSQRGSVRYEHRIITPAGEVRWLDVAGEKMRNVEGVDIFQINFTDISEKKVAELRMKQEWERYRLAAQSGADIIFEYDPVEDRFSYYRQNDAESGNSADKIVFCSCREFIARRNIAAEDIPKVLAVISEGRLDSAEVRLAKDWQWDHIQGVATRDEQGKIIRVVGTIRDITDMKRRESEYKELQQRFSLALRNSYKEVLEINLRNDELYLLNFSELGFSRNKVVQGFRETFEWNITHFVHQEDQERMRAFYGAALMSAGSLQDKEELYCECRQKENDGKYYWRLYMLRRADWDSGTLLFFVRDIDRVKCEEERTRLVLKEALLAAEAANAAKSDFLSRMSHDIRTPMNAIIGMASVAKLSLAQPEKLRDCLAKIDTASAFLLALINDILDMARIESGKLELVERPFSFEKLVRNLEELVKGQALQKNIHFAVTAEMNLAVDYFGDTLRIHQVLMNLLSNAAKFTEGGGNVRFVIRRVASDERYDTVRFTVADTGIGIEEKFLHNIFDPFEQENKSDARNYGGSGLGLSIAKNLVHMMGGTIQVKSKVGKGTAFIVEIPLRREEKAVESAPASWERMEKEYDFHGKRVLIVEDNDINLEIAKALLESKGIEVETAGNGKEAVEKFCASTPGEIDLIFMDIRMPVMDGLAATAAIRELTHADARSVPIVAMTANAFKEDVDKAKAIGMNDYIIKPVDTDLLYQVLERLLSGNGDG